MPASYRRAICGCSKARENVALADEALFQIAAHARHRRKLQGHLAVERAVGALRQPHFSHTAGAQQTYQLVRADAIPGLKSGRLDPPVLLVGGFKKGGQVPCIARVVEFLQQSLAQGSKQVLEFRWQRFQPATPPSVIQGQRLVEETAHQLRFGVRLAAFVSLKPKARFCLNCRMPAEALSGE